MKPYLSSLFFLRYDIAFGWRTLIFFLQIYLQIFCFAGGILSTQFWTSELWRNSGKGYSPFYKYHLKLIPS